MYLRKELFRFAGLEKYRIAFGIKICLDFFFFFDYTNSGTKLLSFQISRAGGAKASPRYALHCLTSLTVSTS